MAKKSSTNQSNLFYRADALLTMIKGRLLLSLIAFIVSFSISLLMSRDFGRAVLSGCVTLFSALVGSAVAEGQYRRGLVQRATALRAHIRALQRRRSETYQSILVMTGERDRIANSLNSLNSQLHNLQVKSATLTKEEVSWNLSTATATATKAPPVAAQTYETRVRVEELQQKESELNRSLSATLSAKQRAELALKTNQAELNQLQAEIVEKTRLKDDISKDLAGLTLERQKLEAALSVLQPKVRELENYRTELNQFINVAEPKRQQVETSSKSLQGSIEQLQSQILSLQNELGDLELQILERRQQKDMLDQELVDLRIVDRVQADDMQESSEPGWQRFFGQLQEPELQALLAIAKQANPSPTLKQIAETNLTMPELLIDGINERAMDTIGDLVIDPSSSSPIVAPEYREAVQQWIEEYA